MAAARPKAKAAVEQVFMDHQSSENCGGVMEELLNSGEQQSVLIAIEYGQSISSQRSKYKLRPNPKRLSGKSLQSYC
ncbi:MAG: hypothetical protein WBN88_04040 [Anderseniella sp.]